MMHEARTTKNRDNRDLRSSIDVKRQSLVQFALKRRSLKHQAESEVAVNSTYDRISSLSRLKERIDPS